MKRFYTTLLLGFCAVLISGTVAAQQSAWPKVINSDGDVIKIYQPQPESFSNNVLKFRSAISILESGKTDPVFGMFWSTAETLTDNDGRTVRIQSVQVSDVKFPEDISDDKANAIKNVLQNQLPSLNIGMTNDELQSALQTDQQQTKQANSISNTPPKVIYTTTPSMLVLIDGTPQLQTNNDWGVEAVVNSPFTIVKNNDGNFYLYGGKRWFVASSATGPYNYASTVPGNLGKVETAVNNAADNNSNNNNQTTATDPNVIPQIIVSTVPAELIQSNGEANFTPIEGTSLLYVKNSANDIFMDVNSQQYYVLLSGRWYKASTLNSPWQYIAADKLPSDFAKIPEGSPKDNVLASVAGTAAAKDAVMEAQIPQTAKVDRKTASANITYDGDPEFQRIEGTRLQYAVNASGTVLKLGSRFYSVDNGVWFESNSPTGPWIVSSVRPDDVELIPPSYPVYNAKYVYIYDVTPDYVYMGYTPGYLNTYVYGPTIVYGTGYYYRPWYRRYYFPRPYTWGFSMNYNPWFGWGVGFDLSFGWFNVGIGRPWGYGYWGGGWWGPAVYRPPYCGIPYRTYGYYGGYRGGYGYGPRPFGGRTVNNININVNYNSNIYHYRRDVVTVDNRRWSPNNRNGNYFANNNNRRFNNDNNGFRNNNRPFNNNNNGNGTINNNRRGNNSFGNNNGNNGVRPYSPGRPDQNNGSNNNNVIRGNNRVNTPDQPQRPIREFNTNNNNRVVTPNTNREIQRPQFQNRNTMPSAPQHIERMPQYRAPERQSSHQSNGGGGGNRGGGERSGGGGDRGGHHGRG